MNINAIPYKPEKNENARVSKGWNKKIKMEEQGQLIVQL